MKIQRVVLEILGGYLLLLRCLEQGTGFTLMRKGLGTGKELGRNWNEELTFQNLTVPHLVNGPSGPILLDSIPLRTCYCSPPHLTNWSHFVRRSAT